MSRQTGRECPGPARRCCGECCYVTECFPCYNTLYNYIDQRVEYLALLAGGAGQMMLATSWDVI